MAETESFCVVRVGDGRFGVDIRQISEVLGQTSPQTVPLAPKFVSGVIPYRGEVLAVVSLRWLLTAADQSEPGSVLVMKDDAQEELFGVAVDAVEGFVTLPGELRGPNPGTLDVRSMSLFDGVYMTGNELLVRLNPRQLVPQRLLESGLFGGMEQDSRTETR